MESRGRTLTRDDFHTDEQYQAYKASKEAAPKAAFQFGVKVGFCDSSQNLASALHLETLCTKEFMTCQC